MALHHLTLESWGSFLYLCTLPSLVMNELPVIFCNSAPNTWVLVPIPSLLLKVIAPVQLSPMSLHYSFFSTGLFPLL